MAKHQPHSQPPAPQSDPAPPTSMSVDPQALQPAEIAAQNVAEMFRDPLRRTRGLEEYLSFIRYAFMAGMAYQVSAASQSPSFSVVASSTTYHNRDPRNWNMNTMQSEP